jgi:heterodisulfide reductase subunit C
MAISGVWTPSEVDAVGREEVLDFKEVGKLQECMQCGTCSASCPVAPFADYTPRQIVNLINLGLVDTAVKSRMVFLCITCYSCTARCPRNIPVADVMIGLRNMAFDRKVMPSKNLAYYKDFSDMILRRGRLWEPELVLKFALKTNPMFLLAQKDAIINLFFRGKIPILPPKSGSDLKSIKNMIKKG